MSVVAQRAGSESETLTTNPVLMTSMQEDEIVYFGRVSGHLNGLHASPWFISNNTCWGITLPLTQGNLPLLVTSSVSCIQML